MGKKSGQFSNFVKLVKNEDDLFLVIWVSSTILTLIYLIEDFNTPEHSFYDSVFKFIMPTSPLKIFQLVATLINVILATLILMNLIFRKTPFIIRLNGMKYENSD
jgi:hypothetical protein